MINAIENAIEVVRRAARDQSESIVRELNADFDSRNIALATYNESMRQVRSIRDQADQLEREAHDALNSALTSSGGIALSIINQINQGQIVSSAETPSPRKKKAAALVESYESDADFKVPPLASPSSVVVTFNDKVKDVSDAK